MPQPVITSQSEQHRYLKKESKSMNGFTSVASQFLLVLTCHFLCSIMLRGSFCCWIHFLLLDTLCTPRWNLCSWNLAGCVGRFLIRFMAAGAESGGETSSSSSFTYSKSTPSLKRFCVRQEPCGAVQGGADGEKSCKIICICLYV